MLLKMLCWRMRMLGKEGCVVIADCPLKKKLLEILFFFFVMKLTRIEVVTFKLNLFSPPQLLSPSSPLLSSPPPPLLHNGNIHSRRQVRSLDETKTGSLLHLEPNELAPWS